MMEFYNKKVCCSPPAPLSKKKSADAIAIVSADRMVDLVPLVVMAKCEELSLSIRDVVYVRSDRLMQGWATERIRVQGSDDEFVLVPIDEVVAGSPEGLLAEDEG